MSWLGDVWKRNRNFVGNALKNVAPVVGALTGGLGGVAIGGLGAALGQATRKGSNIGDILKTGAQNALITSSAQKLGGEKLGSALKSAMRGSPTSGIPTIPVAPPTSPDMTIPGSPSPANISLGTQPGVLRLPPVRPQLGTMAPVNITAPVSEVTKQLAGMPGTVGPIGASPPTILPSSILSKIGQPSGAWSRTVDLIEKYPKVAELGLRGLTTGIEGIAGKGQRAAQERLLAAQAAQMEYELAREQESQRALQGLREQLAQTMPVFGTKRKHVWEE